MPRAFPPLAVAAVAVAISLAACTGTPATSEPGKGASSTFVAAIDNISKNLDPTVASADLDFQFAKAAYETLVRQDPNDSAKLEPVLAEKWQAAPDSKSLVVTLRKGVKFHDGATLDAAAVKASLERYQAVGKGESYLLGGISAITVKDEQTLQIDLKAPNPYFVNTLQRVFIMSPKAMTDNAASDNGQAWFASNAAGTGPYSLKEYKQNEKISLTKFDGYWRGWDGKHVDQVVFNSVPDAATQLLQVKQGTADWGDAITLDDAKRLKDSGELQVKISEGSPFYLMYNTATGPLKDARIREAVSLAVDHDSIIKDVMYGLATRMNGPLPGWMPDYDKSLAKPTFDLEKAKTLMAQAGYSPAKPLKLSFMYTTSLTWEGTVATILQADLKKIGIELETLGETWSVFTQKVGNPEQRPDIGAVMVYVPTPSPQPVLMSSFDPGNAGHWAYWGYSNPELSKILKEAGSVADASKLPELYRQAQQILVDDHAAGWVMTTPITFVLSKQVKGLTHSPIWGFVPNDYYAISKS